MEIIINNTKLYGRKATSIYSDILKLIKSKRLYDSIQNNRKQDKFYYV